MKVVRLFIASSIDEFNIERIYIGDYIRKYNSSANEYGKHVRLFLCEDESSNMQRVYDDEIENSDVFVALIGNHIGRWTRHEIEEVALQTSPIIRKIIFSKGIVDLPDIWNQRFEIKVFEDDFLKNILETLSEVFKDVSPLLPDKILNKSSNCFLINAPDSGIELIDAIIGNIIRRYNVRYGALYNIRIEENLSKRLYDAYVAFINDGKISEADGRYIEGLIVHKISMDQLWVFANKEYLEADIVRIIGEEYYKHVVFFQSNDEFSNLFDLRLKGTILDKILLNDCLNAQFSKEFTYIVEDHILKRVSLIDPENKINVKNLLNIDSDLDLQCRKEKIIVSCMNIYHTTPNQTIKYKEALFALERNAYDFFLSGISSMTDFVSNEYEKFVDYIIECTLLLQRTSLLKTEEEIGLCVDEIDNSIEKSRYKLDSKDGVRINTLLGDILNEFHLQMDKAETYYEKAVLAFLAKPAYDDLSLVYMVLLAILSECEINHKKNSDELMLSWANKGYGILRKSALDNHDDITRCKFKLLIYAARACRNLEIDTICKCTEEFREDYSNITISTMSLYGKAKDFIADKYKENNTGIYLYITLIYEICVNKLMAGEDISDYQFVIEELERMNNKYLCSEGLYHNEFLLANQYIALLSANIENDCDRMGAIIANITKNNILRESNMGLLDMLYVYSFKLRQSNRHQEGVSILDYLVNNYWGKRDKATCLQNKAISHMHQYKNTEELKQAEISYKQSLRYFSELDELSNVGNVNDGLSFCYILQKDYVNALACAEEAINNVDYMASNKYANYISALMCQGHYWKACKCFYFEIKDKKAVRSVLKEDWGSNSEMESIGLDVRRFNTMFMLYDIIAR